MRISLCKWDQFLCSIHAFKASDRLSALILIHLWHYPATAAPRKEVTSLHSISGVGTGGGGGGDNLCQYEVSS